MEQPTHHQKSINDETIYVNGSETGGETDQFLVEFVRSSLPATPDSWPILDRFATAAQWHHLQLVSRCLENHQSG